jgi:hypothetical protein
MDSMSVEAKQEWKKKRAAWRKLNNERHRLAREQAVEAGVLSKTSISFGLGTGLLAH